MEDAVYVPL